MPPAKRKRKKPAAVGVEVCRYMFEGITVDLELESMTLGEQIQVEEMVGRPYLQAIGRPWFSSQQTQAALAFIAFRRRDPEFELSQLLEGTKLDLQFDPPTKAGGKETRDKSGTQSS